MVLNLFPIATARRRAHRRQPAAARSAWRFAKLERFGFPDPAAAVVYRHCWKLLMPVMSP
jgi:hypothetical protein